MNSATSSPSLAAREAATSSFSIKSASGFKVNLLNDPVDDAMVADYDHPRSLSVPGLSHEGSPAAEGSTLRAQSTPGAVTPKQIPAMLPSLNSLVHAVGLVTSMEESSKSASPAQSPFQFSQHSHHNNPLPHGGNQFPPSSPYQPQAEQTAIAATGATAGSDAATAAAASPKAMAKRKYKCTYEGCGKAFTTSGHLARHQRIHTGEKNFPCLFPGCTSRFSRQDNMMQHYRTHLSSKSRRNGSPRKVVFIDPMAAADPYRSGPGIHHAYPHHGHYQHHHHRYGAASAGNGHHHHHHGAIPAAGVQYGLPPREHQHQQQQFHHPHQHRQMPHPQHPSMMTSRTGSMTFY